MKITRTRIPEVIIFEPDIHRDERGYFFETFRQSHFLELGINNKFVQDNQSRSKIGTVRGMHFQLKFPQGKLIRVLSGEVFDVAVDVRLGSRTFGKWVGVYLSSLNHRQLWIPPGFAHGFYVTSEIADLAYKCTDYYKPEDEKSLYWDDPDVSIDWPIMDESPIVSSRDRAAHSLDQITKYL